MKKTKLTAVLICVLFVLTTLVPAAYAADILDTIGSLGGLIGIGNVDEGKVDDVLDNFNTGGISLGDVASGGLIEKLQGMGFSLGDIKKAISTLLGGGNLSKDLLGDDIVQKLAEILAGEDKTTTEKSTEEETTEEETTEEETTVPETTAPPATERPTVYQGPQTYPSSSYVPPVSEPSAEYTIPPTYQYVPVVNTTVEQLTPSNNYVVDDDFGDDTAVSGKMIAGIAILVLSAGAVVVVAVMLKKSRM